MKNLNKYLGIIFIVIVLIFIYAPIFSLVFFSFNSTRSLVNFTGFSFKWYVDLFSDTELMEVIITTIVIAVISTVISTIIGTLAAISLSKYKKVVRNLLLTANDIPIMNPEIITAVACFLLFGAMHIERGYFTLLLAHIGFSIPYVVITVYPKVRSLDPNLTDAAADLGANSTQTLLKVIIPQIKLAVMAGAAIAFTMSFDDFIISYFSVIGTPIQNISIYLYNFKRGVKPTINALSTIIILVIGIKITYDYIRDSRKKEY
jgi:spermidine/putrescine transport system permease protein